MSGTKRKPEDQLPNQPDSKHGKAKPTYVYSVMMVTGTGTHPSRSLGLYASEIAANEAIWNCLKDVDNVQDKVQDSYAVSPDLDDPDLNNTWSITHKWGEIKVFVKKERLHTEERSEQDWREAQEEWQRQMGRLLAKKKK